MIEMRRVHYQPYEGADSESATMCRDCLCALLYDQEIGVNHKYGEIFEDEREWEADYEEAYNIVCDVCGDAMEEEPDDFEEGYDE